MVESTSLRHSPPKFQSYESNSLVVITTAWAFSITARAAYSRVGHSVPVSPHIMQGVDDQPVSPLTLRVTS